jgi:hypothetical protein
VAKRVDEHLTGHATDEGIDPIGVSNVQELIALLREALDVPPKGLVGLLLAVVEVLGVPRSGVGTLEVADKDRTKIALVADATRLELLMPSSSRV